MRESRRSAKEEMQKRMDKETQHYKRVGSLFRGDVQGIKYFKCKEGQNLIDVLSYDAGSFDPIEANSFAYVLRVFVHSKAAQDGSNIICIEQTFKDKKRREELFGAGAFCPVCREYRNQAAKGANKEELKQLRYSAWPRTIYNIYDRRDPGAGVQIWETSAYLFQQYLDVISKMSVLPGESQGIENYIPYMDIEDGRSVSFDRNGTDEKTKFIGIKFEDRRSPVPDAIADACKSLDEIVDWPTVASAHEAFWGVPLSGAPAGMEKIKEIATDNHQSRSPKYEDPVKDVPDPEILEETPEEKEMKELEAKLAAAKAKATAGKKSAPPNKVEPVKEKEKEKEKAKPESSGKGGDKSCPASGVFGKDIDDLPECDKCAVWTECAKENDRLERAG